VGDSIKIILADHQRIFRKALIALFSEKTKIEVLAEADDGDEALEKVEKYKPEIVIMEIEMPKMNGVETVRQIRERLPNTEVIILSIYAKRAYIDKLIKAGAKGYVLKDSHENKLIAAINTVHKGGYYLDSSIADQVSFDYFEGKTKRVLKKQSDPLSEREKEVLRLLALGHTKLEVADILHIGRGTVERHRANIVRKKGIRSRIGLIKYATRIGLIDLNL